MGASIGTAATFWAYFGLLAFSTMIFRTLPPPANHERRSSV